MVVKSFPRKQVEPNIFINNIFVEIFLWLENHFLGNRFGQKCSSKVFWSKKFYGCKFISSKTGLRPKFSSKIFGRIMFMIAKSFPRKQVTPKIFIQTFLVKNVLWLQNHFLENWFASKIFIKNPFVENFLWLQNRFLENRFAPKIFITVFWSKLFYGCKIISWKTRFNRKF